MLSLAICIIGLIVYFACESKIPSLAKVGFAAYWVGLLCWLLGGGRINL